jgi:hypothetical protein
VFVSSVGDGGAKRTASPTTGKRSRVIKYTPSVALSR